MTSEGGPFQLRLSRSAESYLSRLDDKTCRRMDARLKQIAQNPYDPQHTKPLTNTAGHRSAQVGRTWRIVFTVNDASHTVDVIRILSRGQVYRRL